ncbi:hypothetical protein OG462_06450 [Streptomyces sp. NBC_01077]|uniref:hypothetical protein n=1 Tax=Streptomyces sp. NBC_01077 TaxID=2903746 RepID=UPI003869F690|nr:hypothetical protein OG462_06450 [Streptomyces sp. NBC_01077]
MESLRFDVEPYNIHTTVNGQQPGDPAELARALLTIADQEEPGERGDVHQRRDLLVVAGLAA